MKMKTVVLVLLSIVLVLIAGTVLLEGRASNNKNSNNVSPGKKLNNTETNDGVLLKGKTIILDPGHGGRDGGTTGLAHGTNEKELNLKVAKNIRDELQARTGAKVILTREDDNSLLGGTNPKAELQARLHLAKEYNADLFISIHHDAFEDKAVHGITIHYGKNKSSSDKKLAEFIQKAIFKQNVKTRDRGVKESDYMVLRESSVPAVLLELGFTSNEDDEKRMNSASFQEKSKKGIVEGIIEYFGF
jgi:N-acetylmuramoyl-L-alanine amidase